MPKNTSRAPAPPRQMTHMCRKEKTIGLDRATEDSSRENNKKVAAKLEKAFLGKEKHMRFAATRRWKMTVEGLTNKRKFGSRPRATKRETSSDENARIFLRNSCT
jgi:hypothetical protein